MLYNEFDRLTIIKETKKQERLVIYLCRCGCGQEVKIGKNSGNHNKFIFGHQNKGRKHSGETKQKMSKTHKNMSEETKKKLSKAQKGRTFSVETKQKMSKNNVGMAGRKHSKETKQKMSEIASRNMSDAARQKLSAANKGCNHPNWRGGTSHAPYCQEFTKDLKDFIKNRDGNKCMNPVCDKPITKTNPLCVHHINYDKLLCARENLITVCRGCNAIANYNREDNKEMYRTIIKQNYNY